MRASQELRWKQSIKENEERRRRYEETSKRIENEQRSKAQKVLERRRLERARMDELMRNPAQQPAPPSKPILRKGSGAVLRTQATATATGSHAVTQPSAGAAPASYDRGRLELEGQRREWSEGLKQYIVRQREALKAAGDGQGSDQADALSWQELKLAAEAGFEELLRHQEAAAAGQQASGAANTRCPGMLRPKGGGVAIKPPATGAADSGMSPGVTAAAQPSAAVVQGCNQSSSSSPTSKWALRMKQMLNNAMQSTSAGAKCIPPTATAAAPPQDHGTVQVNPQGQVQLCQQLQDQDQLGTQAGQQQLSLFLCAQGDAAESGGFAAAGATSYAGPANVPEALTDKHVACVEIPETQPDGESPCSSPHSAARSPGAGSIQQMSPLAQIATAALRESMEKLHRATDVMLSAVRHSQNTATVTTAAASRSGISAPEDGSVSTGLGSPGSSRLQQVAAEKPSAASVVVRYGAGGCLLESVAASAASSKLPGASSISSSPRTRLHADRISLSTAEPVHTTHSTGAGAAGGLTSANDCMFYANSEVLKSLECMHMVHQHQGADLRLKYIKEQSVQHQQQEVEQLERMQQMQQVNQSSGSADQHVGQDEGQKVSQPVQQNSAREKEPGMMQPEIAASDSPRVEAFDNWHATTQQQQQLAAAKAASAKAQGTLPPDQQQEAANNAAAGPTLDSLLAEVQQLAVLRKALKAEFVAMGHGNIAAAMGTLGLSQDQGLSASQLQPLHPPAMLQQPAMQQQVEQSVDEHDGLLSVQLLGHHTGQAPNICSVRQQASAQQALRISSEEQVKQLFPQPPETKVMLAPEQEPVAVNSAASATTALAMSSSLGQQTPSKLFETDQQAAHAFLQQQQQPIQKPPVPSKTARQWSTIDPKHQQQPQPQGPAAIDCCPSTAESATAALNNMEPSAFAGQDSASSVPGCTSKSELAVNLAAAPMDLSFSFGLGAMQQQNHPASPQLMPKGKQVVLQLDPSHTAMEIQVCKQQTDQQLYATSWQKQEQHQQHPAVQPSQQALSAQQVQQTQEQQQWGYQAQQLGRSMHQTAAGQAPAVLPALLHWNLPAQIKAPAAAAVTDVQAPAATAMPMHLGSNGLPVVLRTEVPQMQYMLQPAECIGHFVPGAMQAAAVVAVKPCSSSSSLCSSPTQRPAVASSWITCSPTSTGQESLLLPGRIGALAAAAARNQASTSPVTAAAVAKRSGSGFLDKLSKQASVAHNRPATSGAASAAGKPTSAGGGGACDLPTAERQLANQGSYLTAALQAKQRVQKEQAERQKHEAATAAVKQAAARKLQEELQEAQKLAVAKAAQQVAPVAIGSYAHTGTAEQQQQHASPARSPGQPSSGSSTSQRPSCTQPSPPVAQNSSRSPPRRIRPASSKRVLAAGQSVQEATNRVAHNSNPGSGLSTPSQPASRIPSAPGTPLSKTASPTVPAGQQRPANGQPLYSSTWTNGVQGLSDSCDSDFDHLERELNGVSGQPPSIMNRPPSRSHLVGSQQAGATTAAPATYPTPVAPVQKAIEAAVVTAATGNKQGMWVAVQAAAAAAMDRNAAKQQGARQQQAHTVATSDMVDSRTAGGRPPTLRIPAFTAHSVAATPAPAPAASTATCTAAANPRTARTSSQLPPRQTLQQAAVGQQEQQRRVSGPRSGTPPKATGAVKKQPYASAAAATNKASAAAAAAANALLEAQRLSLEEAELLASLQQLDIMQAQVKQQTAHGGCVPLPVATALGELVVPQSAERCTKVAAGRGAKQGRGVPFSARAGNNATGTAVAGSRRGHAAPDSPKLDACPGVWPASSEHTAATGSKMLIPSPNKAKEQRQTKLATARAPVAGDPSSRTSRQTATLTAEAASASATAGPAHAASVMPNGWCSGYIPVQPGQQFSQLQVPSGCIPIGFGHPAMAWGNMDSARQQPHGLGPHAAAALAAVAPAYFEQPGQSGMYGPLATLGSMNQMYPGQGMVQSVPYGMPPGQQQQQMYWAAMQAQQYQQWRQQQQQMGVVCPGTAGGLMGYCRPGTGALSQPPLSAPGGSQYMPGSPLLPTLHYQQTVMRNRTSTPGDSGNASGRSSDAGCGVSSACNVGAIGRGHAMGWQQQQPGSADVWPSRGVGRAPCKGTAIAGNGRQGEKGESGTVHVYKPGLLF